MTKNLAIGLVFSVAFLLTGCLGLSTLPKIPEHIPIPESDIDRSLDLGDQMNQAYRYEGRRDVRQIWYVLWPLFKNKDPLGSLAFVDFAGVFDVTTPSYRALNYEERQEYDDYRRKMFLSRYYFAVSLDIPPSNKNFQRMTSSRSTYTWDQLYPDVDFESICKRSFPAIKSCYGRLLAGGYIFSHSDIVTLEETALANGHWFSLDVINHDYNFETERLKWNPHD